MDINKSKHKSNEKNTNESVETVGLPQGVYIVIKKDRNGEIVEQNKIMVNN